jgi:isoleucyl-tRNA synthetase
MAPFLSFTAEEAWKIFGNSESIFFETYAEIGGADTALIDKWTNIRAARELVNKEIEGLREAGKVGSSLQANVELTVPMGTHGELWEALASLGDDLKFVFITSAMGIVAGESMKVEVAPSLAVKCERCWHWRDDVGSDAAHPVICGRCAGTISAKGDGNNEHGKFA